MRQPRLSTFLTTSTLLTVILLLTGSTGTTGVSRGVARDDGLWGVDGSIPDRCHFKTGIDCFSDPKCLWEKPGDSFIPVEESFTDHVKQNFCPEIAESMAAAVGNGTLDTFLAPETVCPIFCGEFDVEECTSFSATNDTTADSAPSSDDHNETSHARRLLNIFSSDTRTKARRALSSTESSTTMSELLNKVMTCGMCLHCYHNNDEIQRDLRVIAVDDAEQLQEICESNFQSEAGQCTSRCDKERLEPGDCYKEDPYCQCPADSAADVADMAATGSKTYEIQQNTKDIICPSAKDFTEADVTSLCEKFIANKTPLEDTISVNPHAVCRGFCPSSGACGRGFTDASRPVPEPTAESPSGSGDVEDMSRALDEVEPVPEYVLCSGANQVGGDVAGDVSSRDGCFWIGSQGPVLICMSVPGAWLSWAKGTVLGAVDCGLCEYCKAVPEVFVDMTSTEECSALITSLLSDCDDQPTPPDSLPADSFCQRMCIPTSVKEPCEQTKDQAACHEAKECRWIENPTDVVGELFQSQMMDIMYNTTCPALDNLIQNLSSNITQTEQKEICRDIFGCDQLNPSICAMFQPTVTSPSTPPADVGGRRRLLDWAPQFNLHFASLNHSFARAGRKLLDTSEFDMMSSITVKEFALHAVHCSQCQSTCENVEEMTQFQSESGEYTPGVFAAFCQKSTISESRPVAQCQSVCSSILPENCAKYSEHCACHDLQEEEDVIVDARYTGELISDADKGWCVESFKPPYKPCFLHQNNECSDDCVMSHGMRGTREEFKELHASKIPIAVKNITTLMTDYPGISRRALSPFTVCTAAGFCAYDMFCRPATAPKCRPYCYCQHLPSAEALTEYLSTTKSNMLDRRQLETHLMATLDEHYGQGVCDHDCDQHETKENCKEEQFCRWEAEEYDPITTTHADQQSDETCVCLTRSDATFRCAFTDGRCSEGCYLDSDLLFRTDVASQGAALQLLMDVGNYTHHNASVKMTTSQICQTLEACSCQNFYSKKTCNNCRKCAGAHVTERIYRFLSTVDYKNTQKFAADQFDSSRLRALITEFSATFLKNDICFAPACRQEEGEENCPTKFCQWQCHKEKGDTGFYFKDDNIIEASDTRSFCTCQSVIGSRVECAYKSEDDKCGSRCALVKDGPSWGEVYSKQYQKYLVSGSAIFSRYKLAATKRPRGRKENKMTNEHLCSWTGECSTECIKRPMLPQKDDEKMLAMMTEMNMTDDKCWQCKQCMRSDFVSTMVSLLEKGSDDTWNGRLKEMAEYDASMVESPLNRICDSSRNAKRDASEKACRPTGCKKKKTVKTCGNNVNCVWKCTTEEPQVEKKAPVKAATPDRHNCTEFMMNWSSLLRSPKKFCATIIDVPESDCVASLSFIREVSAAGHFATMDSRFKLCHMFKSMPTVDTVKERLGFLMCDSSQQCCGKTTAFTDVGITLTESRCSKQKGCTFRTECVPVLDRCYEAIASADSNGALPKCDEGCAFVASSGLNSVKTAHGRGVCVDLLMEERCKVAALFGCSQDDCIEKPVCNAALNSDFGCVGGDSCCVSTTDGVIGEEMCKGPDCQLSKRCVAEVDACGYFPNEWECNYQKNCRFVPLKNQYDRSAGKCVSKKQMCEKLDEEKCQQAEGCRLIDSCQTPICDNDDQCCPLSRKECRADKACDFEGICKMRQDLDLCAFYKNMDECPVEDGLCLWEQDSKKCRMADDSCAEIRDSRACAFNSDCVFEEACVDACQSCDTCIQAFSNLTTTASELKREFMRVCQLSGFDQVQCIMTGARIAKSRGKLMKQPGALCLSLGGCQDSCKDEMNATVSRCSATGWSSNDTVVEMAEDPCANCPEGSVCRQKRSSADSVLCQCDPKTGFDKCKISGTCIDKCSLYEDRITKYNSYIDSCSGIADCEEDFTCDSGTPVRTMNCVDGRVEVTKSMGACVPNARTMTSAQFSSRGRSIKIELNFPARRDQFWCAEIFDDDTTAMLGKALCTVKRQEMVVMLRRGAKIVADDVIHLDAGQTRLRDAVSGTAFVNGAEDVAVELCASCAKPVVHLNYPEKLSAGCEQSAPPKATFDGSATEDHSGRELSCTWSVGIDGDQDQCYRSSKTATEYATCDALKLKLQDESSAVMEFGPTFVMELATNPGFYNMRLECVNFLEKSDHKDFEVEIIGDPMPLISAPTEVTFQKSRGVVVAAAISQDSICPGDVVLYNWTSPTLEIPDGYSDSKDFRMAGSVGTFSEENYVIHLEASLKKADGTIRSAMGYAEAILYPVSSPVHSAISGVSGDVIMSSDIELQTTCMDPDDPENVESGFVRDTFCIRGTDANGEHSLDDSVTQPCEDPGTVTGDMISLPVDSLVADVWYVYTVTCSKDTREHGSSIAFRPRSAEKEIPTGRVEQLCSGDCADVHDPNKDLLLAVTDLAYSDVEIAWTCSESLVAENVLEGVFTSHRLTILAGSLPEVESIDCIAMLSRKEETGEARITVQINSKPFCAKDTPCVMAQLVSETNEFPMAKFKLSASSFADEQEESLTYAFGCIKEDGKREVVFKGTATHYEIGGLAVGSHVCFVSAIDKYGSETSEEVTVEVTEPEEGVTEEVVTTVVSAVDTAVASKDIHAVLTSVKTAASLSDVELMATSIEFVEYSEDDIFEAESPEEAEPLKRLRRRLLSTVDVDSEALTQSVIASLGDFTTFDAEAFKPAATQLAELSGDVVYATVLSIGEKLDAGLIASWRDAVMYSSEEAKQLTRDLATVIGSLVEAWNSDDDSALTAMEMYSDLAKHGSDLLCSTIALGQSTTEMSMTEDVTVGCVKDEAVMLSGNGKKIGDVSIDFAPEFDTVCGDDCTSLVEIRTMITNNMDLHAAFVDALVPVVGAGSIETVSGVVNIEASDRESFCSEPGCVLNVTVPVAGYNASKTTACVQIVDGTTEGLDSTAGISFIEGSYDETDSTVQCAVTNLGEFFVVEFVPVDVETAVMTVSLSEEAEETVVTGTTDTTNRTVEVVEMPLRFEGLDYAEYASDDSKSADLKILIAFELTQSSGIPGATYTVTELREGSVIAVVEITMPESTTKEEIDALVTRYETEPETLFDESFTDVYGTPQVVMEIMVDPISTEEDGINVIAIAVPAIVGVVLILAAIGFFLFRSNWTVGQPDISEDL